MAGFTTASIISLALALSAGIQAAAVLPRGATPPPAPCTPFSAADEFYYKLSGHSSPLYGVQIDPATSLLTAVAARDTNDNFVFEKCEAPSTGYVQGEPITQGYAPVYFGHVKHVSSGKCLRHQDAAKNFILDSCPTIDTADAQLPFWFESPSPAGVVRFTGYKNTTAYPAPEWFAGSYSAVGKEGPPFEIQTLPEGHNGKPNQWVLARPIRTTGSAAAANVEPAAAGQ